MRKGFLKLEFFLVFSLLSFSVEAANHPNPYLKPLSYTGLGLSALTLLAGGAYIYCEVGSDFCPDGTSPVTITKPCEHCVQNGTDYICSNAPRNCTVSLDFCMDADGNLKELTHEARACAEPAKYTTIALFALSVTNMFALIFSVGFTKWTITHEHSYLPMLIEREEVSSDEEGGSTQYGTLKVNEEKR